MNKIIANQFNEMAEILSRNKRNSTDGFRAIAYEKAAIKLSKCTVDLTNLSVKEIQKLIGVGKSSAEKIRQAIVAKDNIIPKLHTLRTFDAGNSEHSDEFTAEEYHIPVRRILSILNPTKSVREIIVERPNTKVYVVELGAADRTRINNMISGVSMPVNDELLYIDETTTTRLHRRSNDLEFFIYFF